MQVIGKRIIGFFRIAWRSCYDMEWYREVRRRQPSRAFGYLALMLGLVSIVSGVLLVPTVRGHIAEARSIISERIPEDATFTIESGAFSTSMAPATEIPVGDFVLILDPTYEQHEPPDAFDGRIGVYVGKAAAIYQDNVEWRAFGFSDFEDVTFTKADMLAWIERNDGSVTFAAIPVFVVAHFFATLLASLVFTLLGALAVMFMGRLSGTIVPFPTWYACGLYALTLPTIVDMAASHVGIGLSFAYPVLFFMIMLSVLIDERTSPVIDPPSLSS